MAYILKPKTETPGFLVFTHREIDLTKQPFRKNQSIINLLKKAKKEYFLGIHIGGFVPRYEVLDEIDAYFAVDSMSFFKSHLKFKGRSLFKQKLNPFHIPLCARNFLDDYTTSVSQGLKFFDIISVARESSLKRLDKFFLSIRKLYDVFDATLLPKVLLVCREAEERDTEFDIASDYYRLFNEHERNHFSLLLMSNRMGGFPMPAETIRFLLASSKVFTLFSEFEGDSRIIHEALLANNTVVVPSFLKGGARDYLTETNSVQFASDEKAVDSLLLALQNWTPENENRKSVIEKVSNDFTIPSMRYYLKNFYESKGYALDVNELRLDNLSIQLPSHSRGEKEMISRDIVGIDQLRAFLNSPPTVSGQ